MRDPHVQSMVYDVGSGEGISYHEPEPMTFSNDLGAFELAAGKLRIRPAEHFPDEDSARQALDPFLRAWEIEADLTSNIGAIRFEFVKAEIIDRNPPPPGSPKSLRATMVGRSTTSDDVELHVTRSKYPRPPVNFRATREVQSAYRRWIRYRDGEEQLQAMAYFAYDP